MFSDEFLALLSQLPLEELQLGDYSGFFIFPSGFTKLRKLIMNHAPTEDDDESGDDQAYDIKLMTILSIQIMSSTLTYLSLGSYFRYASSLSQLLTSLQSLNYLNIEIYDSRLFSAIQQMSQLKYLHLYFDRIAIDSESLNSFLFGSPQLEELSIVRDDTYLPNISEGLKSLHNLKILHLLNIWKEEDESDLMSVLRSLSKLQALNIRTTSNVLKKAVANMNQLEELNIWYDNIEKNELLPIARKYRYYKRYNDHEIHLSEDKSDIELLEHFKGRICFKQKQYPEILSI
jgi:hypothetical protein